MTYHVVKADLVKDKAAVVDFWNRHNEKKLDDKFSWIYESNPDGETSCWLIRQDTGDEIIGMASLFPRRFESGGEIYQAAVQGDFFIQQNHRSLGPALQLIKAVAHSEEARQYDFIYGFPNKNAELILRRAGFSRLGQLKKFTRLLDVRRLVRERLPLPSGLASAAGTLANPFVGLLYPDTWIFNYGRYTNEVTDTLGEDADRLLSHIGISASGPQRRRDYLNWKYARDPDDENRFFCIRDRAGALIGCIAFCFDGDTLEIREALHTQDRKQTADLFALFFKYAKKQKAEYVYFQTYEKSALLSVIDDLRLTDTKGGSSIYFLIHDKEGEKGKSIDRLLHSPDLNLFKTDQDT